MHVVMQAQVQELKLQTNEFFMEEGAVPSHNMTLIWMQSLQLLESINLCKYERWDWTVHCQLTDKLHGSHYGRLWV